MRGGEEEQPNFAFNWNIGIIYFTPPRREGGSLENARSGEDERERERKKEKSWKFFSIHVKGKGKGKKEG